MLLPGGKRMANKWKCGDTSGNPGSSLEVELAGPKAGVWNDSAAGSGGNLLTLWQECRGVNFVEAVKQAAEFVRISIPEKSERRKAPLKDDYQYFDPDPPAPAAAPRKLRKRSDGESIDWDAAVAAVRTEDLYDLTGWRGYGLEFAEWLKREKLIGRMGKDWAIPVHDADGRVICAHTRTEDGNWLYLPKGTDKGPLVIGNPAKASTTFLMESQWDAFALLDRLDHHESPDYYAAVVTRGATPSEDTKLPIDGAQLVVAIPQNDPREKLKGGVMKPNVNKEGRTPSEDWLFRIRKLLPDSLDFRVAATPAEFKDLNDWVLEKNPERREVEEVVKGAFNPVLAGLKTTAEILAVNTADDPNALIGHLGRFLGRGGSMLTVGPSGIGKSTLIASLVLHGAAGRTWHGITFRRPLKILVVQAENDDGDLKEMLTGAFSAAGFDFETVASASGNLTWCQECSRTGVEFCQWLERLVVALGVDLVVIDPLLSYVGDDISQQSVASAFLRNGLQPILKRTGCIALLVHHTGKPSKDRSAMAGWSESDFSYLGLGSSDVTNWARAIAVFTPAGVDTGVFRFTITKRGRRAGMIDAFSKEVATTIFLKHAGRGLGWVQCEAPPESAPRNGGRKSSLSAADVLKAAGSPDTMIRRDRLIAELTLQHSVSDRTVREKVDALVAAGRIVVAEKQPREGGGRPIEWLRPASPSTGNNQMENSK